MTKIMISIFLLTILAILNACEQEEMNEPNTTTEILYTFPEESDPHEGTWLQWPHQYQYGIFTI